MNYNTIFVSLAQTATGGVYGRGQSSSQLRSQGQGQGHDPWSHNPRDHAYTSHAP